METLRLLGSRLLPHDTTRTTSPPAPLACGEGPTILVSSLMRSGTHLLLDCLFNNFPSLRRRPLFVDLDAYERGGLPPGPLAGLTGVTIKTHFPETPLAGPYIAALKALASHALVLNPRRSAEAVRRSLRKWGQDFSVDEFAQLQHRFDGFWSSFSPLSVEFSTLLNSDGVKNVLGLVARNAALEYRSRVPVMPARSRLGVYLDKTLTRALGAKAPRINTTIGYRLRPRQQA